MGNLDSVYTDPTLEAVTAAIEARAAGEPRRSYLGASSLGDRCDRKLWYQFTGAPSEPRRASLIYAAEDGHRTEALVIERLRMLPDIQLWDRGEDGRQIGFTDMDGKFAGHLDGIIKGLRQAPATSHVFEVKCCNEKKYQEFINARTKFGEKQTLQNWDYTYYCQALIYMDYLDLDRHYLVVATPGGRAMSSCRTEAVPAHAKGLREKARRIIAAKEPPARMMEDPSYYLCKWCSFRDHCHGL
jgi:hypothetical protein